MHSFLAAQVELPFSYPDVGATRSLSSNAEHVPGTLHHHRVQLGHGHETFARARAALERWEMFRLGWIEILWPTSAGQN